MNKKISLVLVITLFMISLQPIQQTKASVGNKYNVNIRLDALYLIDDASTFGSFFELDLFINNVLRVTHSTGKISSPIYYDLQSVKQDSDFKHPTSGGIDHSESLCKEDLEIRVNLRNKGYLNNLNIDWGSICLSLEYLTTESGETGWFSANSGYFNIYLYISITDTYAPYIHMVTVSPFTDTGYVTIYATIEDFSVIGLVSVLHYSKATWHSNPMIVTTSTIDYPIYEATIGSFEVGKSIYYKIKAEDRHGNVVISPAKEIAIPEKTTTTELINSTTGFSVVHLIVIPIVFGLKRLNRGEIK